MASLELWLRDSRWEPFHLKITSRPQPWRVGRSDSCPAGDECCFCPRGLVVCLLSASALPSALARTHWLSHGISGVPVLCDVSVLTDHWPSPYTYHRGVWLIQDLTTHVTMVYWCGWVFPGGSAVKNLPAVQELQMWVRSLGQEDPLEEGMTTHSSILAWTVLWTEKPGRLPYTGLQRVRHN